MAHMLLVLLALVDAALDAVVAEDRHDRRTSTVMVPAMSVMLTSMVMAYSTAMIIVPGGSIRCSPI